MEYAVQENHRHMNFLSSGKIIWTFAESVCCIFVIIFRMITAQQLQYNELKKKNYMYSDGQKHNTTVFLDSFWNKK